MMKCSNVSSWRNHDVNYFVLQWASIRLWTTTTMNPRHWLQRMCSINTMRSSPLLVRLASVCKYPGHPVTEIILCNIFHTVYVQSGMTPASKVAISEDPGTQLENPMLHGTHINAKSGICSEGKKHTRAKTKKKQQKSEHSMVVIRTLQCLGLVIQLLVKVISPKLLIVMLNTPSLIVVTSLLQVLFVLNVSYTSNPNQHNLLIKLWH